MSTINLLLVDDEQEYLAALTERLIDKGLNVLSAAGGKEALQITRHLKIDVVVMDVVMPGMSGIGTLREIKKQYPDTEIIMLTGLADVSAAVDAMSLGAFDYLIKPATLDRLYLRIQDAHNRKIQRISLKEAIDDVQRKKLEKHNPSSGNKSLRKWFNKIIGKNKTQGDNIEKLRADFNIRYTNFKLLLAANNRSLELMNEIEVALSGNRPFGMNFIRSRCSRIAANIFQMIRCLDEIKPQKYQPLFEKFDEIQKNIVPSLFISSRTDKYPLVVFLDKVDKSFVDQVGSKMANLGELKNRIGLDIPQSFIITTRAFRIFMNYKSLQTKIDKTIQSMETNEYDYLYDLSEVIQDIIQNAPLPSQLEEAIFNGYYELEKIYGSNFSAAVRSSSPIEDLPGMSVAGLYRSELGITAQEILSAYKNVIAGKYSYQSMAFRLNLGIRDDDVAMCVGVMPMIDSVAGGVVYTQDPMGSDAKTINIYSLFGQPKLVVDGGAETDCFVVSIEEPMRITEKNIVKKEEMCVYSPDGTDIIKKLDVSQAQKASLNDEKILELANLALNIELHYRSAQDIEWAIAPDGILTILQSRPLTQRQKSDPRKEDLKEYDKKSVIIDKGITAGPGVASGPVYILKNEKESIHFPEGGILVVDQALPLWAALLGRASAVITQRGSVVGHLASVVRDYGTPALFGVGNALKILTHGQMVTVDADRKMVFEGELNIPKKKPSQYLGHIKGSPVYQSLEKASKRILPLNMLDPDSPGFNIENCKTNHDIIRYCHEKVVREMFNFGKEHRFPERSSRQLFVEVPMKYWVIDLNDGFSEKAKEYKRFIRLEHIQSVPMLALWRGMMAIDWGGPPPVNTRGFLSAVYESTANTSILSSNPSQYTKRSYFMITKNFVSFQIRIGYHFCTVEALLGNQQIKNYISFVFTGGAAGHDNIIKRAKLIADILSEKGFHTRVVRDNMSARLESAVKAPVKQGLEIVGYLIIHTRQLDMAMTSESSVAQYKSKIIEEINTLKEKLTQ